MQVSIIWAHDLHQKIDVEHERTTSSLIQSVEHMFLKIILILKVKVYELMNSILDYSLCLIQFDPFLLLYITEIKERGPIRWNRESTILWTLLCSWGGG